MLKYKSIMLGTTNVMIRYVEVQQVLVTEISHDKQYNVGYNKCYDQVCLSTTKGEGDVLFMVQIPLVSM